MVSEGQSVTGHSAVQGMPLLQNDNHAEVEWAQFRGSKVIWKQKDPFSVCVLCPCPFLRLRRALEEEAFAGIRKPFNIKLLL